ncbi:TPA: ABC transporter ATP-binding protein [Patescibacteria group bacterium]|nr:MAG: ABC transporter related protein [Parcubacteria group bacterium GW2011_GWF2_40_10]KKR47813.1 MAG: ABC transporter related protein [Parcubacteria group bacterium GW2011_GWA2_40_143]KKR60244.1 MAG: ABC transporter related protein [Parcubacteria group bacterium GW2011_GWC2_40_31]KKR75214.1 MAG: ABC transporter related protein [Parcubacteria group bacterium GW2011_GWB2_40_8]KKR77392.1 MAG: ABC transporter related protein [Parcubacteria group bacterium GW2011_GWE2_40_8]HBB56438.1 ABC transpo
MEILENNLLESQKLLEPARVDSKILEVRNLSISCGGEKILDNISFSLEGADNLVILGPNGAGKSMLLKALLGVLSFGGGDVATSGYIKWKDDVKIGYVPQKISPEKNFPLSVEEFFKIKKIKKEEAINLLNMVGIKDERFIKKQISKISSGQFQRLLVAWSLAGKPDVILMDEPTAGIDVGGEETIYNLIANIDKEKKLSIILVTHDLSVVYKFADNVLCLNKKLICYGTPNDIVGSESLRKMYGEDVSLYKHEH